MESFFLLEVASKEKKPNDEVCYGEVSGVRASPLAWRPTPSTQRPLILSFSFLMHSSCGNWKPRGINTHMYINSYDIPTNAKLVL